MLKVSITTTVFNNRKYIVSAIESVLSQTYPDIEYIVKDAGSTDGTIDVIKKYLDKISKFVSEKDSGIYDGMNQAIGLATGDIIGNMNSDDFYADKDVVKKVVEKMEETGADVCWGDLVYVDKDNTDKIIRYWESGEFRPGIFKKGWMPPHPTFFVRREIYEKYGLFTDKLKISADYELMLRLLEKNKVKSCYIPEILVKMRQGGKSNRNILRMVQHHIEDYKAWKLNGLKVNPVSIILKPLSKITQFFKKQ